MVVHVTGTIWSSNHSAIGAMKRSKKRHRTFQRILQLVAVAVLASTGAASQDRAPQGWWQQEDARYRTSVQPLPYGLESVLQLSPKQFEETLCDGRRVPNIGLMAQDVLPIVPEAVRPPSGQCQHWSLDYSRLVPVLIAAIQQQQEQIAELRREIEQLRSNAAPTAGSPIPPVRVDGDWLGQNVPNPHDGTTTIPYYVPGGVGRAQLTLSDATGRLVRTIELAAREVWGSVTLDMSLLSSGTYEYSLVFDGRVIATKQMQLVK